MSNTVKKDKILNQTVFIKNQLQDLFVKLENADLFEKSEKLDSIIAQYSDFVVEIKDDMQS